MLHWRIREDAQSAEPYFARLRKLDPAHRGMVDYYLETLGESDPEGRLLTVLSDAQRAETNTEEQLRYARELAKRADAAGDSSKAAEAWTAVQRIDPDDKSAGASLRKTFRDEGRWNELAEHIRQEHDALPSNAIEERLAYLRELLPIYRDELKLDAMVTNTLSAITELDPSDVQALNELAGSYETSGRWSELAHVVEAQAEAIEDKEEKVSLWKKASKLWGNRFSNTDRAAEALEHVAAESVDNSDALIDLSQMYTKAKNWDALVGVLLRQYERATDTDTARERCLEAANVYSERLHRHDDAIALLKKHIEAQGAPHTDELIVLESLAEQAQDWPTLTQTLRARIDLAEDSAKLSLRMRLGEVLLHHGDDLDAAVEVWQEVQSADPMNASATMTLRNIYLAKADWASLEVAHEKSGDWHSLVKAMETAAADSADAQHKSMLLNQSAMIRADKMSDVPGSVASLEESLTVGGKRVSTLELLVPIYESQENWSRVATLLAEWQTEVDDNDADQEAGLQRRLAELNLNRLNEPDDAFDWACRAYRISGGDAGHIEILEASGLAVSRSDEIIGLYSERLSADGLSDEEGIDLRRRIAALSSGGSGELPQEAVEQFQQILQTQPTDEEAIGSLDRIYRSSGRHSDLRGLYDHRLSHAPDSSARRSLLQEVAELEVTELGDAKAAAERYEAMLQEDASDVEAVRGLARCYQQLKDWPILAELIERQVGLETSDDEKLNAWLSLGDLRRLYLDDPDAAARAYLSVLEIDRGNDVALGGLSSLSVRDGELNTRIHAVKHAGYEANGDYSGVAKLLRYDLAESTDESERAAIQLRLAEISSTELGDPAAAYGALEGAYKNDPSNAQLLERVYAAGVQAGLDERLANTLSEAFGGLADEHATKDDLADRLGHLYQASLDQPAKAVEYFRFAFDRNPANDDAFSILKQHYSDEEQWASLRSLYTSRIEQTFDAKAKLDLLSQLCFLFEEILEDNELAIGAYEDALELDPSHLPSRKALERLYRREKRWPELARTLRMGLDDVTGKEAIELWYELGSIHEKQARDAEAAVDAYEEVLRQSPTHLRAQEGLQRLATESSQRHRAVQILEPLYEAQGAWSELSEMLELQVEELNDPVSISTMLGRLAGLYESKLRDIDRAFNAISRAVVSDPADTENRAELSRLAMLRSAHRERAGVLEKALDAKPDEYVQTELLVELAEIWDDLDDDKDRAKSAYARLLEHESHNPEVVLRASRALARLHRQTEDPEKLSSELRRQIDLLTDNEERATLIGELGTLLEVELEDREGAIAAYDERLELTPNDVGTLSALRRLHEEAGNWPAVVDVLRRLLSLSESKEEGRELSMEIARVFETKIDDSDEAVVAYGDVIGNFGPDATALIALARLRRKKEQWHELLDVLQTRLDMADDSQERQDLEFEVAAVLIEHTSEKEQAHEAYATLLQDDASHDRALSKLHRMMGGEDSQIATSASEILAQDHRRTSDHSALVKALQSIADNGSPRQKVDALVEAARVSEVDLREIESAHTFLSRALEAGIEESSAADVYVEYKRLSSELERWSDFKALVESVVSVSLDSDLRATMYEDLADIAQNRLSDASAARHFYEKLEEEKPAHEGAIHALIGFAEERGDDAAHASLLQRKIDLMSDARQRAQHQLKLASLYEGSLGDSALATRTFEDALDSDATEEQVYVGLKRLYNAQKNWEGLRSLLERQLESLVGEPEDAHFSLGELLTDHLDDPEGGLEQFRSAIGIDPTHENTILALERMLDNDSMRLIVAEVLEPVLLRSMRWSDVVWVLKVQLEEAPEGGRKELLRRLAEVQESHLEDLEGAMQTYADLFAEDPLDAGNHDVLLRLARVLERWEALGTAYEVALDRIEIDDTRSVELVLKAASLFEEKLDEPKKSIAYYRRAVRFDSTDAESCDKLSGALEHSGKWQALLDFIRDREGFLEDVTEQVTLLHRAATLERDKLDRPADAIETYRRIIELSPEDVSATASIGEALTEQSRWNELADHLFWQADRAPDSESRLSLTTKLGDVFDKRLGERDRAIDLYEEVMTADPQHVEALAALEAIVVDQEHTYRVAQTLDRVYMRLDEWKKRIAVLEAMAKSSGDASERAAILGQIGILHEENGADPMRAFDAWGRAFVSDPHDEDARANIDRLAEETSQWREYVEVLQSSLVTAGDLELRLSILNDVATTQDRHLGDPRAAIKAYQQMVDLDPTTDETLNELEGLQTMVGDWPGLIDVLQKKADRAQDLPARTQLLSQVGHAWDEQIGEVDKAISIFEQITTEDAAHLGAWEALDRLHDREGNPTELARVLESRFDLESEYDDRISIGLRLSALYETQLDDSEKAIDLMRRVVEMEPTHVGALDRFALLLQQRGDFIELVEVQRMKLQASDLESEQVAILHKMGSVYEQQLDDEGVAIEMFAKALEIDSGHEDSLNSLKRITKLEDYREAASRVLEPHLRVEARWSDLAELIHQQADVAVDLKARSQHYVELANIHGEGRQDQNEVFNSLSLALRTDPDAVELADRLQVLAEDFGRWADFANTLAFVANAGIDAERASDYDVRHARIAEERLQDRPRAIGSYQHAVKEVGDREDLLQELDRLMLEESRWDDLHDVLERRLAMQSHDLDLRIRLGDLRHEKLGNTRGALIAYQSVLEENSGHSLALQGLHALSEEGEVRDDALDVLESTYRQCGDADRLLAVYDSRIENVHTDHDRLQLIRQAALLSEQDASRPERALQLWTQVMRLDSSDTEAVDEAERLASQTNDWDALRGQAEAAAQTEGTTPERAYALYLRAARWYTERLNDTVAAESVLGDAIMLLPNATDAHRSLVSLLQQDPDRAADLAAALRQWADVDTNEDSKITNLLACAMLYKERLGDDDRAASALQELLKVDANRNDARRDLVDIRESQERYSEASGQLAELAERSSDMSDRGAFHARRAQILLQQLDQKEAALEAYENAHADLPEDESVLSALDELYENLGEWRKLAELLNDRVAGLGGEAAIATRLRLATIHEQRFEEPENAIEELLRVREIDPDDRTATEGLSRLFDSNERYDDLLALLDENALRSQDRGDLESHRASLERISKIQEKQKGDLLAAIEAHQRILSAEGNATISLRELARLHQAREDWGQATDALRRLSQQVDQEEAIRIAERLTTIASSHVDDPDQRQAALEVALQLDPNSDRTREYLATHYRTEGHHSLLARLLEQDLLRKSESESRIPIIKRLAELHRDELEDVASAARYLEQAVQEGADDREILLELSDQYIAADRTNDAIPLLRKIVEGLGRERSKEAADVHHRLGKALEVSEDADGALQSYDHAFRIDLTNVRILRDLGKLTHRQGDLVRAQKSFRALLLQKLDASAGIAKADVYFYLGDIAQKQGDEKKALSMLDRALAEDKTHEQAAALLSTLRD